MGKLWWSKEHKKRAQDQQWYYFVAEWRVELRTPATQWGAFTTPTSFLCKPARAGLMDNTSNPVAPVIPQRAKQHPGSAAGLLKCRSETHHPHLLQRDRHTVRAGVSHHHLRHKKLKFGCIRNYTGSPWKPLANSPGPDRSDHPLQAQALGTRYLVISRGGTHFP